MLAAPVFLVCVEAACSLVVATVVTIVVVMGSDVDDHGMMIAVAWQRI